MMKTCPNCGGEIKDSAKFCRHCGKKIQQQTEQDVCKLCGAKLAYDGKCSVCGAKDDPWAEVAESANPWQDFGTGKVITNKTKNDQWDEFVDFWGKDKNFQNQVRAQNQKQTYDDSDKDFLQSEKLYKQFRLQESRDCLLQSAHRGNVYSQVKLAEAYYTNKADSWTWYCRAAQQGYPPALRHLGISYLLGQNVAKDVDKGISYLKQAMVGGDTKAGCEYCMFAYTYDRSVFADAIKMLKSLESKGETYAYGKIAHVYWLESQRLYADMDEALSYNNYAKEAQLQKLQDEYLAESAKYLALEKQTKN